MKALTLSLLASLIAGCTLFPSQTSDRLGRTYSTQEFQIKDGQTEDYENNYIQGFVIEAPAASSPTIVVIWRSQNALTADRLVHSTAVGVSRIDGKDFVPPLEQGPGVYALRSDGGTTKLPIPPDQAEEIANAFRRGFKHGVAAVPRVLQEARSLDSLNVIDRVR